MNIMCIVFGHKYISMLTKQTETLSPVDEKRTERTYWQSIICPRCGAVIRIRDPKEE